MTHTKVLCLTEILHLYSREPLVSLNKIFIINR